MNFDKPTGFLSIILGPMWSGKTSKLVDIYKQCTYCDITVLPINYAHDNRYGEGDNKMATHDERNIPCLKALTLSLVSNICEDKLTPEFKAATVILINEGQFFSDIKEWVLCAVEKHKKQIYICGLDGDYRREKFGKLLDLIPFCDKVEKLTSICMICKKNRAIFTHRIQSTAVADTVQEQILIGTAEYIPLCRYCYTV